MNQRMRIQTGWTLIGLPIFFHTLYELFWKVALRGVPEPAVDVLCITAVAAGVILVAMPPELRVARRYKR